ncbi:hypothetical protein Bca52824_031679 [Brassica carinata]|uniref:RNase H type-1 domain-containing protein n=1 Tax=Brassica carinata TaxID=52824 RepID=A0A8X7SB33_BRACI|nr:hypothetical protein Bca52824_031679 [Brassica carinata]
MEDHALTETKQHHFRSCFGGDKTSSYPATVPELHHIISAINTFKLGIEVWRLDHVAPECNLAANAIACSVTSGHRYQSYIASGGPVWLHTLLGSETNGR